MDPDTSWLQTLLGISPAEAAPLMGAPMRTPEEVAAGRSSILGDIAGSAYPGPPAAAGPTGGIGNLPPIPPPAGTAPSVTAGVPPPTASYGGGPMAGAPSSLFPWVTGTPPAAGPVTAAPPSGAPTAPTAPAAAPAAAPEKPEDRILKALRGVSAPPAPVAQKVDTPKTPVPHPIQIANMLALLGIPPTALPRLGALGGGRIV